MTAPLLSLQNLAKHFGSARAVDGLNFDVKENEFFALLGASGSGKTTLLRMLAGFETPTAGQILLDGKDISLLAPNHRPVNLMFQSYALFPHMTVAQNISYGLEMEHLPKRDIKSRVDEMLEIIQLSHLSKRKPDQLSGGQRQRVALGRALIKRPRLLLLDEPLGALDKKLRGEMQLELKRIQHEFGITFIIVTHDQEEALVMADRVAILKDGKLLQCASPHEIYEHPENRFAAEFIGVMNFLPGTLTDDGLRARDGSRIIADIPAGLPVNSAVEIAVRPERLRIGKHNDANNLKGRVVASAYHELDLQLHLQTDLSPTPVLVRLTAHDADSNPQVGGDEISVGWSAKDTRVFPMQSDQQSNTPPSS